MLRKILLAISLVVLAACATTMDDADDYSIAAYEYYQNGNYQKAIEAYTKALEIQENILGKDDIKNAVIYNNMGLAYAFMGEYEKALEFATKALAIQEKILGKENTEVATSYNNMGLIY
ncbi:MAG: DUF2225 domain-containing protein, partial [Campylobacter concisus]|nr:DUF2225 domain-containing protein [Campylobacter concisus]